MNFYKFICLLALILLLVCLAFVAVGIQSTYDKNIFPPHVSDCPDFYVKDTSGNCVSQFLVQSSTDDACYKMDFDADAYNADGKGPYSGICAKKTWAQGCKVNWDGITNDPDVCYTTNS